MDIDKVTNAINESCEKIAIRHENEKVFYKIMENIVKDDNMSFMDISSAMLIYNRKFSCELLIDALAKLLPD